MPITYYDDETVVDAVENDSGDDDDGKEMDVDKLCARVRELEADSQENWELYLEEKENGNRLHKTEILLQRAEKTIAKLENEIAQLKLAHKKQVNALTRVHSKELADKGGKIVELELANRVLTLLRPSQDSPSTTVKDLESGMEKIELGAQHLKRKLEEFEAGLSEQVGSKRPVKRVRGIKISKNSRA